MNDPEPARRHRDHSRFLPLGDLDDLPATSHPRETKQPEQRQDDPATPDFARTLRVK